MGAQPWVPGGPALGPHGAHLLQDARLVAPADIRHAQRAGVHGRREDDDDERDGF